MSDCFGPGFESTATHTRTPKIQAGPQLFIDEVTDFDPGGGPWGRGFMRCETAIADDDWFFDGHFKNDPCMPGNFMVEACIEAMSFYLAALGHTAAADGWRFQPLPEQPFELKCRGEINPRTDRVAYELYVEEVWGDPHPTMICDVLGSVDGQAGLPRPPDRRRARSRAGHSPRCPRSTRASSSRSTWPPTPTGSRSTGRR